MKGKRMAYRGIVFRVWLLFWAFLQGWAYPVFAGGEQTHLQTDRDIYVAGEHLYFKALLARRSVEQDVHSGFVYLVLQGRHGQVHASAHRVGQGWAGGTVYLHDTLSSGTYDMLAFTNWMRNRGEEAFAYKKIFVANRFDRDLAILDDDTGSGQTDDLPPSATAMPLPGSGVLMLQHPGHAGKREQVVMTLAFDAPTEETAFLTVTVTESGSLARLTDNNRITGQKNPARVPTPRETAPQQTTPRETAPPTGTPPFFMETTHMILSGRVTEPSSGEPLRDIRVVMNTPCNFVNLLYATTGNDGAFHFALPDAYLNRTLYLTTAESPEAGTSAVISLWDRYVVNRRSSPGTVFLPETSKAQIYRSQDIVRAQKAYEKGDPAGILEGKRASGDPVRLYSEPLQRIIPGEYTAFDDLQEIAREIVPKWRIRRSGNDYRSSLICAHTRNLLPGSPVYFLDGIMVHDLNQLVFLHSELLDRIEIQNTRWVFGEMEFPGIIGLFSKEGIYRQVLPGLPVMATQLALETAVGRSALPSHEKEIIKNDAPDLRQMLYWDAGVTLEGGQQAALTFFTGDLTGEFVVRVEGYTAGGERLERYSLMRVE